MRVWSFVSMALFGLAVASSAATAAVDIRVDLSSQTMQVSSGSGERYVWPVSTARKGFRTPRGTYGVQSMAKLHFSRKYDNSPMPHSIFFDGGYAIHGSYATASLGRAASHGCIRLSPHNAATLYEMVEAEGARITITGSAPRDAEVASREHRRRGRRAIAPDADGTEPLADVPLAPSFDDWPPEPSETLY